MKDTIRDQIKALADKNGWLLIIIGLAAVGFSDIKMTMTLLQWAVFSLVIAGLVIVISRITFPQIKLSELMERVKSGDHLQPWWSSVCSCSAACCSSAPPCGPSDAAPVVTGGRRS